MSTVNQEMARAPRAALIASALIFTSVAMTAGQTPATSTKNADWQIASAVLALPAALRDGAEVRGWNGDELVLLRAGSNGLICLADRADQEGFAAACYQDGLEPFMKRGRELSRQGVAGAERDEIRWREIKAGTLPMPAGAMVYNLRHSTDDIDPATFDPATASRLHSFYIPNATPESTGVSTQPSGEPWLMHAGTPSAHIMIALPAKAVVEPGSSPRRPDG